MRLFRIAPRARDLLARWRTGAPVGSVKAAQVLARRLVSSGAFSPRPVEAAFHPPDVTVVVPVRDRPAQLDRLLGALDGLACVVVDDASADAGVAKEIAERHGARFVGLTSNAGPSGARNAGLEKVHSALVAFVDSDCVPVEGWLGPLLGHFDDPLVAAVAPRIVAAAARPPNALSRFEGVRSSLDRGQHEGPVRPGSPIPFVPSAALLVRTDVVTGTELFDASLRGGEDVDLVWRLTEAGWDIRYVPASTVEHDGAATLGAFLARRAFYGTTAAPLARRHPGTLAPVHVSGWSVAVWGLALARRPRARAGDAGGVHRHPGRTAGGPRAGPRPGGDAHRGWWDGSLRPAVARRTGASVGPGAGAGSRFPPHPKGVGAGPGAPGSG